MTCSGSLPNVGGVTSSTEPGPAEPGRAEPGRAEPGPADLGARAVRAPQRLVALDGLRGIAAVVVLLYHMSLIARPAITEQGDGALWDALSASPLKLAFAGTEAVLVFFALSGLVVALPALRVGFQWTSYLSARLLRIYLPVWGALAIAAALILLIPRDPSSATPDSWLGDRNATEVTASALLSEAGLFQSSYRIDNPLWSLRWEIVFSVLLPVFVAIAMRVRSRPWIAGGTAIALTVVGRLVDVDWLVYLPIFLLGTLVATRLDDLLAWGRAGQRRLLWAVVATGSAGLLIAGWLARPLVEPDSPLGRVLWGLAGAGAIGMVVVAVASPGAARVLGSRPARWLGRVSFSLYLIHVPVLATLGFALGEARWPLVALVGVPLSLLLAAVFARFVEQPAHRLARRAGEMLGRGAAQPSRATEPTAG